VASNEPRGAESSFNGLELLSNGYREACAMKAFYAEAGRRVAPGTMSRRELARQG
jgi:hypothetical protein